LVGYTLIYIGSLFLLIAGLPEIMELVQKKEGFQADNEDLNNKAAGIYNTFLTIGSVNAPIIGGVLDDKIGYRYTNDTMAFVCLAFVIFYAVANTKLKEYRCKRNASQSIAVVEED